MYAIFMSLDIIILSVAHLQQERSPDRAELYEKTSILIVVLTDPNKDEFRLITNRHHDVVISASIRSSYCN